MIANLAKQGAPCLKSATRSTSAKCFKNDRLGVECLWYPGATPPAHLDGSMPGDYGFDPFNLGDKEDAMRWYREAELYNGRVAMVAVPGIAMTDYFGINDWWTAGATSNSPLSLPALIAAQIALFGAIEYKRYESYKKDGVTGVYSMAPFDPLKLNSEAMQVKEVKNGRLAMLSFLGYVVQNSVTGKGPTANLQDHLSNPMANNIFTSWLAPGFIWYTIYLVTVPIWKEFDLYGKEDQTEPNLFNDTEYKRFALYGIFPAFILYFAFGSQILAGVNAYKAAGLA